MGLLDRYKQRIIQDKLKQIENLFQEAKGKIIQILVHPDASQEQLGEALVALRSLDKSVKDIRARVSGVLR